jgi:HD-GYP domain-containing protein (c-di-GMP phosphodiesterase class II)
MVVGRTIFGVNGDVLLRRGVVLSERYIDALWSRGYASIYICDGFADEVGPEEIISETVRAAARKHLGDLFTLVRGPYPSRTVPKSEGGSAWLAAAAPLVAQLSGDVERIVEEALSAEVVDGIISLKSHDNYSFEHSVEVTVVSVMLGKRLHLPLNVLRQLALGGMLHDMGKTFVPTEILNKPNRLTPAEFAIVQQHPTTGYEIVRQLIPAEESLLARHVVWQHHERQDGSGYPRALRGRNEVQGHRHQRYEAGQILLVAEIAAVADVYSALASDRPYRAAMEPDQIVSCLREMAGWHLNQEIVRRFLSILPVYPVGAEVVILTGEYQGYRGVVVSVDPKAIDRPVIRVLFDPNGYAVPPFEIDTQKCDDLQVGTAGRLLTMAS